MGDKIQQWGEHVMEWLHLDKLLYREKSSHEFVAMLYPRERKEKALKRLWGKRLAVFLILMAAAIAAWLFSFLSEPERSLLSDGRYLTRQSEDSSVEIYVAGTSDSGTWEKKVYLNLIERKFTEGEKEELDRKLQDYGEQHLRGENESLDKVTKPLSFFTARPETQMELNWFWDEEYIREDGKLVAAQIPKEGVDTDIMLKAAWKNWKKTLYFHVHLMPPELSLEQQQVQAVKDILKKTLKDSATEEIVELPGAAGDIKLAYHMEEKGRNYTLVYLILVVIVLLPILWHERQKKEIAKREEQMYLDYPGIVNKVMLLLGAGMTFRKSVERLAYEYERNRNEGGGVHYAYEELCIMMQEMKDGISEGRAVENFGKKCRLMPYLRFSSVITQNLKKGAEGILDLLEQEALEAMEQRRQRVLQMGETAGTKLLFPMIVMLGLVMGIIMVPAFMTL